MPAVSFVGLVLPAAKYARPTIWVFGEEYIGLGKLRPRLFYSRSIDRCEHILRDELKLTLHKQDKQTNFWTSNEN